MTTPANPEKEGETLRIAKLMAQRGLCSRREAEALIARRWVSVNGAVVEVPGTLVTPDAVIELHPEAGKWLDQAVTILLNKPVGIVSGQPEDGYKAAIEIISQENQYRVKTNEPLFQPSHLQGLAPAGRLDIDSHGLLVLTQDGRIARQLIGEDSTIDKEYLVRVSGEVTKKALQLLNFGLQLDGKALRRARVKLLEPGLLQFILREGKKRQIRRMCMLVGLEAINLKRVRIGKIRLGSLPYGQWRFLEKGEHF